MKNNSPIFKESSTNRLPFITLVVLGVVIALLMYIGYDSFFGTDKNELTKADKLKNEELISDELPDVALSSMEVQKDTTVAEENSTDSSSNTTNDLEEQKKEAESEKVPEEKIKLPEGKNHGYVVEKGETFLGIANRFSLKFDQLKALNPGVDPAGLKVGVTKLNVKVKAIHTVGPGDVLRVVAEKYHVSKESIMKVNHKDQDITLRGEQLIIPLN
ncbi:MAG: LysM peptidoglycan-binding domain-containing protein [Aquirufa sp.]